MFADGRNYLTSRTWPALYFSLFLTLLSSPDHNRRSEFRIYISIYLYSFADDGGELNVPIDRYQGVAEFGPKKVFSAQKINNFTYLVWSFWLLLVGSCPMAEVRTQMTWEYPEYVSSPPREDRKGALECSFDVCHVSGKLDWKSDCSSIRSRVW